MNPKKGAIYLIPNTLGGESTHDIIPAQVSEIATGLRFFAVEEVKSARRLLRKLDRTFPIDDSTFFPLNKRISKDDLMALLLHVLNGNDLGVISEAGCPVLQTPEQNSLHCAILKAFMCTPWLDRLRFFWP